jgi:hypothetical protein
MNFKLPSINAQAFSRELVIRRGSRGIAKFLDMVGPVACGKIIAAHTPLASILPAEQLEAYQQLAAHYYWLANLVSDEDFGRMLPPWFLDIVKSTPGGTQWLIEQIRWLRTLFSPPVDH